MSPTGTATSSCSPPSCARLRGCDGCGASTRIAATKGAVPHQVRRCSVSHAAPRTRAGCPRGLQRRCARVQDGMRCGEEMRAGRRAVRRANA